MILYIRCYSVWQEIESTTVAVCTSLVLVDVSVLVDFSHSLNWVLVAVDVATTHAFVILSCLFNLSLIFLNTVFKIAAYFLFASTLCAFSYF